MDIERRLGGRRVHRVRWVLGVVGGAVLTGAALVVLAPSAHALPACGGQNAAPQPVPYTCVSAKTIDGTVVTATVTADGHKVTVSYQLATGRATDTPIRIIHHPLVSGSAGVQSEADGVIPAGMQTATLSVATSCRAGQLDIKFLFVLGSQSQGRVGGPWIQNGTNCAPATTVVPTSISVPGSSVASSASTTTTPARVLPATITRPRSAGQLPATGGGSPTAALAALFALAGGVTLIVVASRRLTGRFDPDSHS
jgi:hypothetical protein